MKIIKLLFIIPVVALMFSSCEEYEDYMKDYEITGVYFGTQKPLRTIVARENMQFKFGAVLGGKRENKVDEWAKFMIDPELLNTTPNADAFVLLPESYYSLSNDSVIIIPKGAVMGDVTVTLNREAFTSDPDAISNTYALPLRLTSTSADTILSGNEETPSKDYTIIVVKYISPNHGYYYHKGVQQELGGAGEVVKETAYSKKDLVLNELWQLSTAALNVVQTSGAGTFSGGNDNFQITLTDDNAVVVESRASSAIDILTASGQYDASAKSFYLQYEFERGGVVYNATDTLILRQDPELDLRFEEW